MDNIFNSEVRVKVLALLYGVKYCEFNYLLKKLGTSPGNLWTHLKRLEKEGYVEVKKYPLKKGVRTIVKITEKGAEKFREYLNELLKLSGGEVS
ncbi:winged helix-turn-helix domain-containing protein [Methanothermococcus sp. SCGC AD-155-E23]|nr:winged helix-turn-helix domain-containing protein [Methanothermococcus sp. SCGC AD-155-E23]